MFCSKCGQKLREDAKFCANCGNQVAQQLPSVNAADGIEHSATEFFDAPPFESVPVEGVEPPTPDAQEPQDTPEPEHSVFHSVYAEDAPAAEEPVRPADPFESSATEFFSAPPMQGATSAPPPPADSLDLPGEHSATEFFSAPPAGGAEGGAEVPAFQSVAMEPRPAAGPILKSSYQQPGGPGGHKPIIGRNKSRIGLFIGLGVAALLVVFAAVGLFRWIGGMSGGGTTLFWISDGTLMYAPKVGGDSIEVLDDVNWSSIGMSENGKYAYVLIGDYSGENVLYRAELGRLRKGSEKNSDHVVKLDSNIKYFSYRDGAVGVLNDGTYFSQHSPSSVDITKDGTKIYYIKSDENRLRCASGENVETLERDVETFQLSPDEKTLLVEKQDGEYRKLLRRSTDPNGTSETVIKEYSYIDYNNKEFTEMLYVVMDYSEPENEQYSLYYTDMKESKKLVGGVASIFQVASSNLYYYTRAESEERPLSDFVQDDMAAKDASVSEPRYSDYERQEQYVDYWGDLRTRIITDYDAYNQAYALYREKQERDWLRQSLSESFYDNTLYSLYLNKDGKEVLLAEGLPLNAMSRRSGNIVFYSRYDAQEPVSLKLSQITSTGDVYDALNTGGESLYCVADITGELAQLPYALSDPQVSKDGTIYGIEEEDQTLVCYAKGTYTERKQLAQDVNAIRYDLGSDTLYFLANWSGDSADLYRLKGSEKVKIAGDVELSELSIYKDGALAALGAYTGNSDAAEELIYYDTAGNQHSYGEDVGGFQRLSGAKFLVLEEFRRTSGTLYLYGGKERARIADDVSGFQVFGDKENASAWFY